jgi:pimeloyl-ACP methyl ester carboxylesterase
MESFRTADGRVLEYLEVGDPGGRPVGFLHGTPGTAGTAVLFDDAARHHNVRLFALSRPGYGSTSMTAPGLVSVGEDLGELATGLGIGEFDVLGVSGGGPFALAAGSTLTTRVRHVAVAAGPAPCYLIAPEVLESEDVEALELLARGDVDGAVATLTAAVRRGFDAMCQLPADEFEAAFNEKSPSTYFETRPADRSMFIADFHRGLARYDGFVRDNLSWNGPWDFGFDQVAVPVLLYYGAADSMVAPSHGEWLAARLPNAKLTLEPLAEHGETCFGRPDLLFADLE